MVAPVSFFDRGILRALVGVIAGVWFGSVAVAADLGDSDLATVQVWYQPTLMASVDEAAGTINALRTSFCDWRGGIPENVFATRAHVDIHTNIHSTEESSEWVPSWGGIITSHGYTPYSGGSMQTTQNESDDPADISLVPGEISGVTLWSYPDLERDYKFGFDLQISNGNKQNVISFRTPNVDIAKRLADAFATLAAANFSDGRRFTPAIGFRAKTDDLASQYTRLNWTQGTELVIDAVVDDSPAASAGIAHDDIIFEADGKPVADVPGLVKIAGDLLGNKPDGRLDLKVFRGGQTVPLQVALTNPNIGIEKLLPAPVAAPAPAPVPPVLHLGIAARNLTPEEAKKAKLNSGVLIVGVDTGSLAQQMGLQVGDYLLEINGSLVADMNTMKKLLTTDSVNVVKIWRKAKVLNLNGVNKL